MTPAETPFEAGLGFCVKLDKKDFIGREALLKAKANGLRRKLCPVTFDGTEHILYGGEAVYANNEVVGRIRSAGYGHTIRKAIGYTYLPMELAKAGAQVFVDVLGEQVPALVSPDPLFDPEGTRLRV